MGSNQEECSEVCLLDMAQLWDHEHTETVTACIGRGKGRKYTRVGGRLLVKRRSIEVEEGLDKVLEVNVKQVCLSFF